MTRTRRKNKPKTSPACLTEISWMVFRTVFIFVVIAAVLAMCSGCIAPITDPHQQVAAAQGAIQATHAARTLQADHANATAQALDNIRLSTQAAIAAQATAQALQAAQEQAQAQATDIAARTTDQALQAAQLATAQARQATETQAAGLAATGTAWPPTATAQALVQAREAAQATSDARREQREERAAVVSHYAGLAWRVILPAGLAALFLGAIWALWANRDHLRRWLESLELRNRTIDRGRDKDPLIITRLPNGAILLIDPARLPAAAAMLSGNGLDLAGLGLDQDLNAATIERAQAADLARALPPGREIPTINSRPYTPQIEVFDAKTAPVAAWIEEVETRLLEEGD